eukprot:754200-Hanusia_phi.AAC.3
MGYLVMTGAPLRGMEQKSIGVVQTMNEANCNLIRFGWTTNPIVRIEHQGESRRFGQKQAQFMSSLASSPPKGGGSQSLQNWARMQSYSEAQIRQQMLENSLTGTMQQMERYRCFTPYSNRYQFTERYPPEMTSRRLAMEEMGIAHGNGLNDPCKAEGVLITLQDGTGRVSW